MDSYKLEIDVSGGLSELTPVEYIPSVDESMNSYSGVLSSSSWSAVVHQPSQDSEYDDLPSTIDMDAIKDPISNAMELLSPIILPNIEKPESPARIQDCSIDDDSSSSNSESDNENEIVRNGIDGGNTSSSDSVSSHRSKDNDKSDSSSGSSSPLSYSPRINNRKFSVRESNIDQGGLKLKLSLLKPSSKLSRTSRNNSYSSVDDDLSDHSDIMDELKSSVIDANVFGSVEKVNGNGIADADKALSYLSVEKARTDGSVEQAHASESADNATTYINADKTLSHAIADKLELYRNASKAKSFESASTKGGIGTADKTLSFGSADKATLHESAEKKRAYERFLKPNAYVNANSFQSVKKLHVFGSSNKGNAYGITEKPKPFGSADKTNAYGSLSKDYFGNANKDYVMDYNKMESMKMNLENKYDPIMPVINKYTDSESDSDSAGNLKLPRKHVYLDFTSNSRREEKSKRKKYPPMEMDEYFGKILPSRDNLSDSDESYNFCSNFGSGNISDELKNFPLGETSQPLSELFNFPNSPSKCIPDSNHLYLLSNESSSDNELLLHRDQIVSDVINTIQLDVETHQPMNANETEYADERLKLYPDPRDMKGCFKRMIEYQIPRMTISCKYLHSFAADATMKTRNEAETLYDLDFNPFELATSKIVTARTQAIKNIESAEPSTPSPDSGIQSPLHSPHTISNGDTNYSAARRDCKRKPGRPRLKTSNEPIIDFIRVPPVFAHNLDYLGNEPDRVMIFKIRGKYYYREGAFSDLTRIKKFTSRTFRRKKRCKKIKVDGILAAELDNLAILLKIKCFVSKSNVSNTKSRVAPEKVNYLFCGNRKDVKMLTRDAKKITKASVNNSQNPVERSKKAANGVLNCKNTRENKFQRSRATISCKNLNATQPAAKRRKEITETSDDVTIVNCSSNVSSNSGKKKSRKNTSSNSSKESETSSLSDSVGGDILGHKLPLKKRQYNPEAIPTNDVSKNLKLDPKACSKVPPGVFEPSTKHISATKTKKTNRNIAEVLSKLTQKLNSKDADAKSDIPAVLPKINNIKVGDSRDDDDVKSVKNICPPISVTNFYGKSLSQLMQNRKKALESMSESDFHGKSFTTLIENKNDEYCPPMSIEPLFERKIRSALMRRNKKIAKKVKRVVEVNSKLSAKTDDANHSQRNNSEVCAGNVINGKRQAITVIAPKKIKKITKKIGRRVIKVASDVEKDTSDIKNVANVTAGKKVDEVVKNSENQPRRKRKKWRINKTGFPSIKRKKKPVAKDSQVSKGVPQHTHTSLSSAITGSNSILKENLKEIKSQGNAVTTPKTSPRLAAAEEKQKESSNDKLRVMEKRIRVPTPVDNPVRQSERIVIKKENSKKLKALKDVENKKSKKVGKREPSVKVLKSKVAVKVEKEDEKEDETSGTESYKESKDSTKCSKNLLKAKTKILTAGLFSDFYKENGNCKLRCSPGENKVRPAYKSEEHPYGLMPAPPYCDDWVRRRRIDFRLPFDLWWMHKHKQLPAPEKPLSWNYKKIRSNVYSDQRPTAVHETHACNCHYPPEADAKGCKEDCINRLVFTECSPQLCRAKEKCSNQRIQKYDWAPGLVKYLTGDKGYGVKTNEAIRSGEFIIEYTGEVVTDKEFKKRMTTMYSNDIHHYCLNLDGGFVIDAHRYGNYGRFVNHSCEPNCEMQKWCVNGISRMIIVALRDIQAGEELCYDYNFALFNPTEGQPCFCGSENCRGVIGGRSQRIDSASSLSSTNSTPIHKLNNLSQSRNIARKDNRKQRQDMSKPKKVIQKKTTNETVEVAQNSTDNQSCEEKKSELEGANNMMLVQPSSRPKNKKCGPIPKPLTEDEINTIHSGCGIFLIRNHKKVITVRERIKKKAKDLDGLKECDVFKTQLNALNTQRCIKTRQLTLAEENPELTKTAKMANMLRSIHNDITNAKDENNEFLSSLFLTLPSKRKLPSYYQRITDPIDLTTIKQNIETGVYKCPLAFDADVMRMFSNYIKFYTRTSEQGIMAARLRKEYNISKIKHAEMFKEILGEDDTRLKSFLPVKDPGDEEEDVIRCICGLCNDEGLMIQCERCLVWQHKDCIRTNPEDLEQYYCERCKPRNVDYDIPLDMDPEYAKPGEKHFLTLMRDQLQVRQGETVYVLRDMLNPETGSRHTYSTIAEVKYEDCDIFRVERLWKNENGERLSFGYHYMRPHETFHEPTRRFFPNEVLRVCIYETVPLDLIVGQCWVLDLLTYCKGKPIDADPQHIYICDYKVDKAARMFTKIKSSQYSKICTKNFAFERYREKLKPQRTYAPHGEVSASKSGNIGANGLPLKSSGVNPTSGSSKLRTKVDETSKYNDAYSLPSSPGYVYTIPKKEESKKDNLNSIALKLLAKGSTKSKLDASYLLVDLRRNRKKPSHLASCV